MNIWEGKKKGREKEREANHKRLNYREQTGGHQREGGGWAKWVKGSGWYGLPRKE